MRTNKGLIGATALAAALLMSACGANTSDASINLSDSTQLSKLCGEQATQVANSVSRDANSPTDSGNYKELQTKYHLNPNDKPRLAAVQAELAKAPATCPAGTASPSPTASASPSASTSNMTSGTAPVADKDGKRQSLPSLSGAAIPGGNTTSEAQMPPLSGALALDCGTLNGWDQLVPCIDKSGTAGQKYAAQVDKMHAEGSLSFTWSDVQKWATAKTKDGKLPEDRVIQVYGYSQAEMPADQARANIADLVGGKDVAANLQVVYKEASFIDTLRPKYKNAETTDIEEFVDFNKQVRVSLVPLVLDNSGAAIGIDGNSNSGVFVDCYNIHGIFTFMPAKPGEVLKCLPGTAMAGQPLPENGVCTPPTTTTPPQGCTTNCGGTPQCTSGCGGTPQCTTNCGGTTCYPLWGTYPNCYGAKNPALGTQNQGNNMPGGGGQAPVQQDKVGAPAGGTPPQTYVAPPAPAAPAPTQAPPVQVQQPSGPQPTVAPSTQPPNNGYVNPTPTGGGYCNPDFQSCPTK